MTSTIPDSLLMSIFMHFFRNNNDVGDAFLIISNSRLQVYILYIFYLFCTLKEPFVLIEKTVTFSHQVHGSESSLAYLQYLRGTPINHRGGGGIGTVPSALMILLSPGDHF
ncbi:hypothetical protein CDAR_493641 [Caerostris darwini]|uniref:Uncharacterized protein n=1 Tax=Caerostris darwini TaxID=1538125 RepID=A0AAV4VTE7_9ARAC|nr:hypothetical protein CDAR_493641 [Caerostris darwini]